MNDTKLGLVALLLLNPIVLVILVVVGVVGMAIGIGAIIYYGLTTGIVLFAISGLAIVFLHYAKIVDLQKQPILIAVPPIMFGVGYVTQRLRIFSITPVTMPPSASAVLSPSATLIAQIVIVALIIVVAYMVIVKARR